MDNTHAPTPHVALLGAERELAAFAGGSVVQLVSADAADPDAMVVELVAATVVVTTERVVAAEGDLEWSWLLDDLAAVHHSPAGRWSILAVPGIADHGVAVPGEAVDELRRRLAEARPDLVGAAPAEAPAPPPPTTATTVAPEQPSVEVGEPAVDLTGEALEPGDADVPAPGPTAGALPPLPPPPPPLPVSPVAPARAGLRERLRRGGARPVRPDGQGLAASASPVALAALDAREISAWFGTHHVLDRVSLSMPPGQVTALIGPSGCGKSTFLRILNRMHEMIGSASLSGEVLLDGEDIYDPQRKLTDARRQIGMVFQKPNPFPAMSIYDNVVASYRLTGTRISNEEKDDVVERCLRKAGLWTEVCDRLRSPGGGLSGGQQQRLCIARALAIRPRVLLMDEPCSALDPTSTRRIEETIMELGSEVTIVIVTHNMQQAARVSDRCAFFLAEQGTPGVIVEHGPTEAMFHSPQDPRTSDYVNGRFG